MARTEQNNKNKPFDISKYFASLQVGAKETKPDQWNEYVQRTWGICQKKKRSDLRLDFWNMGNCSAHDLHMTSFCPYYSFSIL